MVILITGATVRVKLRISNNHISDFKKDLTE